jgi:hypothetical protein
MSIDHPAGEEAPLKGDGALDRGMRESSVRNPKIDVRLPIGDVDAMYVVGSTCHHSVSGLAGFMGVGREDRRITMP